MANKEGLSSNPICWSWETSSRSVELIDVLEGCSLPNSLLNMFMAWLKAR